MQSEQVKKCNQGDCFYGEKLIFHIFTANNFLLCLKKKKKSLQKKVPLLNSIETLWRCGSENKSLGHLKDEDLTFKM